MKAGLLGLDEWPLYPLPNEPTGYPAGSREKNEVMRQRDSQGRQLHHPDDSQGIEAQRPDPKPPTYTYWMYERKARRMTSS